MELIDGVEQWRDSSAPVPHHCLERLCLELALDSSYTYTDRILFDTYYNIIIICHNCQRKSTCQNWESLKKPASKWAMLPLEWDQTDRQTDRHYTTTMTLGRCLLELTPESWWTDRGWLHRWRILCPDDSSSHRQQDGLCRDIPWAHQFWNEHDTLPIMFRPPLTYIISVCKDVKP